MYPQLFWGTLALLHTVHVPLHALVLRVLCALLRRLQLSNLPTQNILLAAAPPPQPRQIPPAGARFLRSIERTPAEEGSHDCLSCNGAMNHAFLLLAAPRSLERHH